MNRFRIAHVVPSDTFVSHAQGSLMTRRWSLIATIVVLAVGLAFVVTQLVRGQDSEAQAGAKPPAAGTGAMSLAGLGWWPLHGSGIAKAGEHDAVLQGGAQWADGGLRLDGSTGFADTGTRIDTDGKDYSVAARVRMTPEGMDGFHTAVSQDGDGTISAFFLQYSGQDQTFAFSFPGARTLATDAGAPQADRWYHLVGTYSHQEHRMRIYVDGHLAGSRQGAGGVKPGGSTLIGRAEAGGEAVDHWNGDICDVHVYDRELTADDAASLSSHEPG